MTTLAHTGPPVGPHDLWGAWTLEPTVLIGVALAGALYARGVAAVWRQAGRGRVVGGGQAGAFAAGLVAVLVALVSPLDALADALFSAHMVQHVVLVLLAAPLLVIGEPLRVMPWALLPRHRVALLGLHRRMGSLDSPAWPAAGLAAHVGVVWLWHLPGLYQAAVIHPLVHIVMHATMLGAALFFWWSVAGDAKRQRAGVGVVVLFLATFQNAALSVHMAFLPLALYPVYADTAAAWGLTLLEDQQAAGMIMWVPGTIAYLITGAALFVAWLRADERAASAQTRRARARGASPVTSQRGG